MKLKKVVPCLIMIILCSYVPAMAEFFHYVDDRGVSHYTDNISEVPKEQRKGMDIVEEVVEPEVTPTESPDGNPAGTSTKENSEEEDQAAIGGSDGKQLRTLKDVLDKEHADIVKSREELISKQKKMKKKEFNDQVDKLQKRIDSYKVKNEEFNIKVDKHNAAVKQLNKKKLKTEADE